MCLHRIADHVESLDTSTKVRGMFDGMRVSPTKTEVNGANLNATNRILPPQKKKRKKKKKEEEKKGKIMIEIKE